MNAQNGTTTVEYLYPETLKPRTGGTMFEFVQGADRLGCALLATEQDAREYAQRRFPYACKLGIEIRPL